MIKSFLRILFILAYGSSCISAGEGLTDVEGFRKNSSLHWKWALESLEVFPFQENDQVLDLGCRDGSITAVIAAKVPFGKVIGLAISEEMLFAARTYHPLSNVIYMHGDPRKLPFVEQFDKVVAFLSMNWIKEQDQALHAIYRALKPGGRAIITRPGKQPTNLGPLTETLVKTDRWAPYFPNFVQKKHYYSAEEYSVLLEDAGFVVEKVSQDSTWTSFKDKAALIGFFRPVCNFIEHLPPKLQLQFVEEIVEELLEIDPPLADGSIQLHDFKLEAIISKPMR